MPAKPSRAKLTKDRPLTADEQRFIHSYVKLGGVEDKIELAEKRAHLKPGTGRRMLGRAPVLAEVHLRMEPKRMEQMRQQMLGDTVAEVTKRLEEKAAKAQAEARAAERELSAIIACPEKLKVRPDLLEDALMRMAVGLDMNIHPQAKLSAIQAAFVVAGIMEQGTTRRVGPMEGDIPGERAAGIYQGLFGRLRAERQASEIRDQGTGPEALEEEKNSASASASVAPARDKAELAVIRARIREITQPKQAAVYDLMPGQGIADSDGASGAPVPLPAFGEPVDGLTPPPARNKAGKAAQAPGTVLTVEVG